MTDRCSRRRVLPCRLSSPHPQPSQLGSITAAGIRSVALRPSSSRVSNSSCVANSATASLIADCQLSDNRSHPRNRRRTRRAHLPVKCLVVRRWWSSFASNVRRLRGWSISSHGRRAAGLRLLRRRSILVTAICQQFDGGWNWAAASFVALRLTGKRYELKAACHRTNMLSCFLCRIRNFSLGFFEQNTVFFITAE